MKCKKPYMWAALPSGCGQCLPCRINRRRLWSHRILLESATHASNTFVTLTYRDLTSLSGLKWKPTQLNPKHPQDFIKRLRKRLYPHKIRYYLVGEYGDDKHRPHYHMVIFGMAGCYAGRTNNQLKKCCENCEAVKEIWGYGRIELGEVNAQSAMYICGYVTKKLTGKKQNLRKYPWMVGRHPEFARMSLGTSKDQKGGIGASAMTLVASTLEPLSIQYMEKNSDVPTVLQHGPRKLPLGRYLRSILRQKMGYGRKPSEKSIREFQEKMYAMQKADRQIAIEEKRKIKHFEEKCRQESLNVEKRFKIMEQRRSI